MTKLRATGQKALVAAAGALATGLGTAMLDGALSWQEVVASVGGALVFGGGVWKVQNGLNEDAG